MPPPPTARIKNEMNQTPVKQRNNPLNLHRQTDEEEAAEKEKQLELR